MCLLRQKDKIQSMLEYGSAVKKAKACGNIDEI